LAEVGEDAEQRIRSRWVSLRACWAAGWSPARSCCGGDPGIGKSTLMLQLAMQMAGRLKVLYVSGEESERQVKMRAGRIAPGRNCPQISIL